MKRLTIPAFLFLICSLALISCGNSRKQDAQRRLDKAQCLIDSMHLQQARLELDSIHLLYPKQVDMRRQAKALNDSITYIEAQRTLAYSDSLLQTLFPKADNLLKSFRHEKNDKYEDHGRYVHPLLITDRNTSRCMLQAEVTDESRLTLKSFYFGNKNINHTSVRLSCEDDENTQQGSNHSFQAEGWHEILTFNEEQARQLLNFISANKNGRIKVTLLGDKNYIYYLQNNEKEALEKTYQLYITLSDIRHLEQQMNISRKQIEKFANKSVKI